MYCGTQASLGLAQNLCPFLIRKLWSKKKKNEKLRVSSQERSTFHSTPLFSQCEIPPPSLYQCGPLPRETSTPMPAFLLVSLVSRGVSEVPTRQSPLVFSSPTPSYPQGPAPTTSLQSQLVCGSPQAPLGSLLLESQPLASVSQALLVLSICTPFHCWLGCTYTTPSV